MAKEFEVVDVWVGRFPSSDAVNAYLAETYREDDDETPISQFAADTGQWFYDHDFVTREFYDPPVTTLAETFDGDDSFLSWCHPMMLAAFAVKPFSPFNVVLLACNREIENPVSVAEPGRTLHYLGRFERYAADRSVA